ncbi:BlaI/MecI/CopY family transcriptional regulator [Enterobacter ludwigii]|nr:BlaI/MecI/CopY family transcriptional regulator [Enterobacter ludwigii]
MQIITLTDFIRKQTGEFTARQIHDRYKKIKPSIRTDSVLCQLNRLVRKNELKKIKIDGRSYLFISQNQTVLTTERLQEISVDGSSDQGEAKRMARILLALHEDEMNEVIKRIESN